MSELSENERHQKVMALQEQGGGVDELILYLGDPSWRIRKAAIATVSRFREHDALVYNLVNGLADADNAGLRSACADALVALGEQAVPSLVANLKTPDADQRKFIVEVLGTIGTPAAQQGLLNALDDGDDNVRASVADALGRMGGEANIRELTRRLGMAADNMQLSAYILDALAVIGARLSYEELAPWIGKTGLERLVVPLLGRSRDERSLKILVEALPAASRGSRVLILKALAQLSEEVDARAALLHLWQSEGGKKALTAGLGDGDDGVARAAVILLGFVDDAELAPQILMAAACKSFVQFAVDAVRAMGPKVVPPLMRTLADADTESRVLYLEVIELLADQSSAKALLEVAMSGDARTSEAAVRALGRVGTPNELESLLNLTQAQDVEVARQASLSLTALGTRYPDAVAQAVRRRLDTSNDVAPAWLLVLGSLGRDEDLDGVISAIRHQNPHVRRAAIDALSSFRKRVSEQILVFALTDESSKVRAAAARALSVYSTDTAMAALLAASRDTDPWVVVEALRSLGASENAQALPTLQAAAASSVSPVAIAALQALQRFSGVNLRLAVEKAAEHVDPEVVREAILSTQRLSEADAMTALVPLLSHRSWHVRFAVIEMFWNRELKVDPDRLHECLAAESEDLLKQRLQKLLRKMGD